jgi:hypothetical protein
MQFLAILRLRGDVTEEQQTAVRRAEIEAVWDLAKSGIVRSIHFIAAPGRGAVMTIEAVDLGEATGHIDTLPAVRAGLLDPEIIGLAPFSGYEVLFHA